MKTIEEQFNDLKQQYPDALFLFRVGDFYEAYNEDAIKVNEILGVMLTKREDGSPICGFPFHALDVYLAKLVRAGNRVAICDQLNKPEPPCKSCAHCLNDKCNKLIKSYYYGEKDCFSSGVMRNNKCDYYEKGEPQTRPTGDGSPNYWNS